MNTLWGWGRASWAGCGPDVRRGGHPEIDADHGIFGREEPANRPFSGPHPAAEATGSTASGEVRAKPPHPRGASCNNAYGRHHGAARGGVGAQLVGDQSSRKTALGFQQRPKEADGCSPIPMRLHEDVQDVTVLVYCAPQILLATLDRDEHLVEMPSVSHPTAPAPQLPGVDRTEPLAPLPNRLVGDRYASLREEIFSIAEAEAESIVEPNRVADDVRWESISVIAGRLAPHRPTLPLVAST